MKPVIFLAIRVQKAADFVVAGVHGAFRRILRQAQPESTLHKHNNLFRIAADRLGFTVRNLSGRILEISNNQSRIFVTSTNFSFESLTAYWICGDKHISAELLTRSSLPVPEYAQVLATDYQGATEAFRSMEKPVVVKPVLGACGRGVTVDVRSDRDFRSAFISAARFCNRILIERFVTGNHWRVTVLDGELIVAWQRISAHVVGDGSSDMRRLIRSYNATLKGEGDLTNGLPIPIDRRARRDLAQQGSSLDSVPEKGEVVTVILACNSALGGRTRDVTDEIHPEYIEIAGRAARVLGVRFAGVDIIAEDITSVPLPGEYYINEVNTTPDMLSPDYALNRKRSAVEYAAVVLSKALAMHAPTSDRMP